MKTHQENYKYLAVLLNVCVDNTKIILVYKGEVAAWRILKINE